MILIPLLCHDKNSGVKVLEGDCYDKLRQSSAIDWWDTTILLRLRKPKLEVHNNGPGD